MFITGDIVKVEIDSDSTSAGTVIHRHEDNSYDVLIAETGEILNIEENSVFPVGL